MSASQTLKQTIYSKYTKYTCMMDSQVSDELQPMVESVFTSVDTKSPPLIKINVCYHPDSNEVIWLIDTAMTDRKFPPEDLQTLMVALSNTNLELVPCPESAWSRISALLSS